MNIELEGGFSKLALRAKVSTVAITAYVLCAASFAVLGFALIAGDASELANYYAMSAGLTLIAFVLSAIAIGMWIHRAHANLFAADIDGLQFTPGWSVGWFFVPFANLVQPYSAMRELWRESSGDNSDRSGPLPLWWGSFLVGGLVENIGSRMVDSPGMESSGMVLMGVGTLCRIVSAVALWNIIQTVTCAQPRLIGIAGTFA